MRHLPRLTMPASHLHPTERPRWGVGDDAGCRTLDIHGDRTRGFLPRVTLPTINEVGLQLAKKRSATALPHQILRRGIAHGKPVRRVVTDRPAPGSRPRMYDSPRSTPSWPPHNAAQVQSHPHRQVAPPGSPRPPRAHRRGGSLAQLVVVPMEPPVQE